MFYIFLYLHNLFLCYVLENIEMFVLVIYNLSRIFVDFIMPLVILGDFHLHSCVSGAGLGLSRRRRRWASNLKLPMLH